jgi:hypothetical protein
VLSVSPMFYTGFESLNSVDGLWGTPEKFRIWRAILTYDQPKMSSFSVIRGYVWFLSLKFFEFHD